jgi:hypothetical protein
MADAKAKATPRIFERIKNAVTKNKLVVFFFISHVMFATILGRLFAFAPDEQGYLYTFNHVYTLPINTNAQGSSGWITAPTVFLWIAFLPAKILNLVGVPDYLSIRSLSIAITTISLFLLLRINQNVQKRRGIPEKFIFLSFFIPSVFLWTSTGLREAFIIFEITLFLVGLNYVFLGRNKPAFYTLFVGSYGLISTKPYLWVLLMVSLLVFSVAQLILRTHKKYVIKLIAVGFIAPLILFVGTTSKYALDFIFSGNTTEAGARCGDSISQIEDSGSSITFKGDYTLIALHFYLLENQDSVFTKLFTLFNLDKRVKNLWNEKLQSGSISKLQSGSISKSSLSCNNNYSLNGATLKPGVITEPWTMLMPAFIFLAGPFPLIGEAGIAATIASFESPLWWLLYTLVIFQFYRFKKFKLFRDPAILFTLIFLAGEIAFSSLVEVNLGTSFRHRSILLVPLVFLYVRITQRAHELPDSDSKQTT